MVGTDWTRRVRSAANGLIAFAVAASCAALAAPPTGTAIPNRADASFIGNGVPARLSSNVVTAIVTTAPPPALTLDKSASNVTPSPGSLVRFDLRLTNSGGTDAEGVAARVDGAPRTLALVRDTIPANTTFASFGASAGALLLFHHRGDPALDYLSSAPALDQIDEVAFGFDAIAAGSSSLLQFSVRINDNASGATSNVARVDAFNPAPPGAVTALSNLVRLQIPPQAPDLAYYKDANFDRRVRAGPLGQPLYLQGDAADCNHDPLSSDSVLIQIQSTLTGDREQFAAREIGVNTGQFRIDPAPPTADARTTPAVSGNQRLETLPKDLLIARLISCEAEAATQALLSIDPHGVVFDSVSGAPVAGAVVSLIDEDGSCNGGNPGGLAQVFEENGTTPAPAVVNTGADGLFSFPVVGSNCRYRLQVEPPSGAAFPSSISPTQLPAGFTIDRDGSYGRPFLLVAPASSIVTDIPVDATAGNALFLSKTGSRREAEVGDSVDYKLELKNGTAAAESQLILRDRLPRGFIFQRGSARLDGRRLSDPAALGDGTMQFELGDLPAGQSRILEYRVGLGAAATLGDGINRAVAIAQQGAGQRSNRASFRVAISAGPFDQRGAVLGTVFADCDGDRLPGRNEPGVPGVRLYLEDGTFVVTDGAGRYSIYGQLPETHALAVDTTTLPPGAKLEPLDHRHADSGSSRFIDLKRGELQRADFAIAGCSPPLVEELSRRAQAAGRDGAELAERSKAPLPADTRNAAGADFRSRPAAGMLDGNAPVTAEERSIPSALPSAPACAADPVANLDTLLPQLDPTLAILDPCDRCAIAGKTTNVRVKGPIGASFFLALDGTPIPESRVGLRSVLESRGVQLWEYIGVELQPGENHLTLVAVDQFGNQRGEQQATVFASDRPGKIVVSGPASPPPADGQSVMPLQIHVEDRAGLEVTARTLLTCEVTRGTIKTPDLDPLTPGTQLFAEHGLATLEWIAPREPGWAELRITHGKVESRTRFDFPPELRPLFLVGLVDARLDLRRLELSGGDPFERAASRWSRLWDDESIGAAARAGLFLKGRVLNRYLVTAAYDSDKPDDTRLLRDIEPDRFFPIYGDDSARGFEAQSTGHAYLRVDAAHSYALLGDFTTEPQSESRQLSAYARSLTGARYRLEQPRFTVDGFSSRDRGRQVVDELPARGISGPYRLSAAGVLENSEQVELLIRDRNAPSVVLERIPQSRFVDYVLDPLAGELLFKSPVHAFDPELNPISIRVSYEVESGGSSHWVSGLSSRWKLRDNIELGGSYVSDRNPAGNGQLAGIDLSARFGAGTVLFAEQAWSERFDGVRGSGNRFELRHDTPELSARLYSGHTDTLFSNLSSPLPPGRDEIGGRINARLGARVRFHGELLHTRDSASGARTDGELAAVETTLSRAFKLELGVRHSQQSAKSGDAFDTTSWRTRLGWQPTEQPRYSLFGEYEQSFADSGKRIAALGGEYRLGNRGRLYARHELISSLGNLFSLDSQRRRQATIFGVDLDSFGSAHLFSEYRVANAIGGRDAEAAIGLRDTWQLKSGVKLLGGLERIQSIRGNASNDGTALTGGVEFLNHAEFKSTARVELRTGQSSNGVLSTFGLARQLGQGWSLLARNALSVSRSRVVGSGDAKHDRLQLGLAWRQPDENRWNLLARVEFKLEQDATQPRTPVDRRAQIATLAFHYLPRRELAIDGTLAAKTAIDAGNSLRSSGSGWLASGRVTLDLGQKWDIGASGGALLSSVGSSLNGAVGLEAGRLIHQGLWLSLGANLLGFRERDLDEERLFDRGYYLRLRFKFDAPWLQETLR